VPSRHISQGSLLPLVLAVFAHFGAIWSYPAVALAQETTISVDSSFPLVGQTIPPPWDLVEGGRVVTFTGNHPIVPLETVPGLEPVDTRTWQFTFEWDRSEPLAVSFVGEPGDTVSVEAFPRCVIPFGSVESSLPVFHLRTDSTNLWDPDIGIYVYGLHANFEQRGAQWERPTTLQCYDAQGDVMLDESIGLRINGGWSRRFDQKSLRLYFDGYGDQDDVTHDFFGSQPTTFERLILRTHRFPANCLNSNILEGIWLDRGHLGSRIAPVETYVNNEYWGIYSLRERLDDEFMEVTHGLVPGSYDFIKDGETIAGNASDFWSLLVTFSTPQDFASHAFFAEISEKLDLPSYIDWLLLNIFGATADNGFSGNVAQYRVEGGPWTYVMWDEDDTFYPENLNSNHFRFLAAENEADFEDNRPPVFYYDEWSPEIQLWCTMFNRLMHNSEFRALFFSRLDDLLAGELSPAVLHERIDMMVATQQPAMDRHAQRWAWSGAAEFTDYAEQLKDWVGQRRTVVQQQADEFRDLYRLPVELVDFQAELVDGAADLRWVTWGERGNRGFVVLRDVVGHGENEFLGSFATHPELTGHGDTDSPVVYTFTDPDPVPGALNRYKLFYSTEDGQSGMLPWVEAVWNADLAGLVINEVMADNDSTTADSFGEFDDWFEIYNGTTATVVLDSLFVTDDPTLPTAWMITGDVSLAPGEHYLLWADGMPEQGVDHCGFKLDAAGEGIQLYGQDGSTLVTTTEFSSQLTDVSWARVEDGSPDWTFSAAATPGAANGDPQLSRMLRLNELMVENHSWVRDEALEYDPWLEVYNPLPLPLILDQVTLTYVGSGLADWDLDGLEVPAGGFLILWMDGQPEQGSCHCPFVLEPEGSLILGDSQDRVVFDTVVLDQIPADWADARMPNGYGIWEETAQATPGASNPLTPLPPTVVINEFMASNSTVIADETGMFEDWVELTNVGIEPVDLGGMFLTDDLALSTRWSLPAVTLAPGDFLLIWCDNDVEDGPLHAPFKLSAAGEQLGLYSSLDDGNVLIDGYSFGPQTTDVSEGRETDGGLVWVFFSDSTPGSSNYTGIAPVQMLPRATGLLGNYPNPFNPRTNVAFTLAESGEVLLTIHDLRGRLVARLVSESLEAGTHIAVWDGRDLAGRGAASGVYLVRLQAVEKMDSRRIMLLK